MRKYQEKGLPQLSLYLYGPDMVWWHQAPMSAKITQPIYYLSCMSDFEVLHNVTFYPRHNYCQISQKVYLGLTNLSDNSST